jgi:DNA-binding transcriptional ArsR family regulator
MRGAAIVRIGMQLAFGLADPMTSPRPLSPQARAARKSLLGASAAALLGPIREALCEPTRTQIVRALSSGPLSVSDLAVALRRSRTVVSQHLRVLREGGVVVARRRGRTVSYSLVPGPMTQTTLEVLDRAAGIANN